MNKSAALSTAVPDTVPAPRLPSVRSRWGIGPKRRGAAVVEFAIVVPIFFLMVFGMIEFGRMVMVHQLLTGAAREGARQAIVNGATAGDVEQTVRNYLTSTSVDGQEASVSVTPDPATANTGEAVTVETGIDFEKVSWLPAPFFLQDLTLNAASTMRHE
jgi:Flp pilus assembly protein TadG